MKYLYFKDANDDAQCYPADNLLGIIHDGDLTLKLRFVSAVTGSAAATEVDLVTLAIKSNTETAVCEAIVGAINDPRTSGFIVVANATAGELQFLHPSITGTAATLDT
jgi:hypothetical protein